MKIWILHACLVVIPISVFANPVVCTKKLSGGPKIKVSIEGLLNSVAPRARVNVFDESGHQIVSFDYHKLQNVWDGHTSGLATANGFSFVYNNWYGCIKNAVLVTHIDAYSNGAPANLGTIEFEALLAVQLKIDYAFLKISPRQLVKAIPIKSFCLKYKINGLSMPFFES